MKDAPVAVTLLAPAPPETRVWFRLEARAGTTTGIREIHHPDGTVTEEVVGVIRCECCVK